MSDQITFEDFSKLDFRVGKVLEAKDVEGSDKMIRLVVDFGDPAVGGGKKIIFSALRKWYKAEDMVGKVYTFLFNLEPRPMFGEESQGMIIAAETDDEEVCSLLIPDKDVPAGTPVH